MTRYEVYKTRIELLFFDPSKDHDTYLKYLHKVRPGIGDAIYSPLYNLRNEIYNLTLEEKWLSAILVSHIVIGGIMYYFFQSVEEGKARFYNEFMGLHPFESTAHRVYRNAREHNFGQLVDSYKYGETWHTRLFNEFISLRSGAKYPKDKIKVTFNLSIGYSHAGQLRGIDYIKAKDEKSEPYHFIKFDLNPKIFIDALNTACDKLKKVLLTDEKMQTKIMEDLTEDNWLRVSYPPSVTLLPENS